MKNFYEIDGQMVSEDMVFEATKKFEKIIEVENEVETEISEEIEETEKTETSENEVEVIPVKTKKTSKK